MALGDQFCAVPQLPDPADALHVREAALRGAELPRQTVAMMKRSHKKLEVDFCIWQITAYQDFHIFAFVHPKKAHSHLAFFRRWPGRDLSSYRSDFPQSNN